MTIVSADFASTGTEFVKESVGGMWRWVATVKNINGLGQRFEVSEVRSPFGLISKVNLPIPGDVIQAMAESISSLTQQVSAEITITSPNPTEFFITVTEGAATIDIGSVTITNSGAFGSFLTVNSVSNVSWLSSIPSQAIGIAQSGSADFQLFVDPTQLLAAGSPFAGEVSFSSADNPNDVSISNIVVTVVPKPEVAVVPTTVTFTQAVGIPSAASFILTISNVGPVTSLMDFTVAKVSNTSPWLEFTPASGGGLIGGTSTTVTLSLITSRIPNLVGTSNEIIRVTSPTSSNGFIDIPVALCVTTTGGVD